MNSNLQHAPGHDHLHILKVIRSHELDLAVGYFPRADGTRPIRILELGAGTGLQARQLQELGYEVMAIDLPSSPYRNQRTFPVTEYDGTHIPAPDGSFHVVFSSNVLEHVVDLDGLLRETRRVLKPGGTSVHLMPTALTRLWSIPAHYIWLTRRIVARIIATLRGGNPADGTPRTPSSTKQWVYTLFPARHGERGNTLTEIYYFSRVWWEHAFASRGFKVEHIAPNGIFYTMANAAGTRVSIPQRRTLAKVLGSACAAYILRQQ